MTEWHALLRERLAALRVRPEREAEIVDELAQHLDDRVSELVAGGLTWEAARADAVADLDEPGELARRLAEIEARAPLVLPPPGAPARGRLLQAAIHDVRHAIRGIRRAPVFAITVVLTLALTIGPTTAILSIGNWLLWRPAPGVQAPERLALAELGIWSEKGRIVYPISHPNLMELRAAARTVHWLAGLGEGNVHLAGEALPATEINAGYVTAGALDLLGVRTVAGRGFHPEDDRLPLGEPVVIVRAAIARRAFGTAEAAPGQRLTLNGRPMTVIGVVTDRFTGLTPLSLVDVWYPSAAYGYVNHALNPDQFMRERGLFSTLVVRLPAGVALDAAQAELDVLMAAFAERLPEADARFRGVKARLSASLGPEQQPRFGTTVNVLLAIGGVLLLLGCANVANVLMLRAVRMSRDRAVRLALGASRARLVSLQLTESAILSVAGAAVGILLAIWLKAVIVWLLFPGLPPGFEIGAPLDERVLLMTLGVSVLCGLFAGFIPALVNGMSTATSTIAAAGGRSITATRWLRGGLAGVQLALSLALVIGSLLLASSLKALYAIDLGFDPAGTSRHLVNPTRQGYPLARTPDYFVDLVSRVQARPGLEAVAASGLSPFGSSFRVRLQDPAGADQPPVNALTNNVTARYFDVLRLRFVRGRGFTDAEGLASIGASYPVVIDEGLAKRLFGDADPIGRFVIMPAAANHPQRELPVIGVTESAQWNNIIGERPMFIYQPFRADIRPSSMVLVRSPRPMVDVTREVRAAAREIDPSLPVRLSQPISSLIESEVTEARVFAWMLSLLSTLAFTLAAVGLYGLLAQSVTERTREFGVRLAMGSGRGRIFGLVLRHAAWIAAIGTVAGLTLAAFGTRLIEAQLYGVTRLDPMTYGLAALALAAVVFVAAVWPARAATRIEPVDALRAE
jgi:predicted permease